MRFNSYEVFLKFVTERGYSPKFLIKNRDSEPPDPKKQINVSWLPYNHYRIFGFFDSESLMYLVLMLTQNASDHNLAKEFCLWSPYISSLRECLLFLCKYLEKLKLDHILLPFGGIPYYVPVDIPVEVLDNDFSIQPYLQARPKCKYTLNLSMDLSIFERSYKVKTIVCVNFSNHLLNYDHMQNYIDLFYDWLENDGLLILNLIVAPEEYEYKAPLKYHRQVTSHLNTIPKSSYFYPSWSEVTDVFMGKFAIQNVYGDKFGVNYLFMLRKIQKEILVTEKEFTSKK